MTTTRRHGPLAVAVAALFATACASPDRDDPTANPGDGAASDFTLQLLHVADMDGTANALENVAGFSALVGRFRSDYPDNTLFVSAGDNYIPGPRYFAAADEALTASLGVPGEGRGDIALLNAMGLQASAVGNHELDLGTSAFASLVAPEAAERGDGRYVGAAFPYLASNLDFSRDEETAPLLGTDGAPAETLAGRLASRTTVDIDGRTIGIVAATTPTLRSITSSGEIGVRPADADDIDALATVVQDEVDALVDTGIDVIVLLAHMQQIAVEQALATRLHGVDIIVAGGSNTLLADSDDSLRPGDVPADDYPLTYSSSTGEPVLLVNVDGDYRYLGRLVTDFDAEGVLLPELLDAGENGAWASTDEVVGRLNAEPDASVSALSAGLRDVLVAREGNIAGRTAVYLDGRRAAVRTEETNLGNLTADANLWLARQADATVAVSLKNGGGIRADIGQVVQPPGTVDPALVEFLPPQANEEAGKGEGDVSEFDLQQALRFNNGLSLVTLTVGELRDVLEHAVAATEADATPGQFPQIGGLAFSFDPAAQAREGGTVNGEASTPGQRVRSMVLLDDDGRPTETLMRDGDITGDASRPLRVVILDFIAKCVEDPAEECGDGYPLQNLAAPDRVDLVGGVDTPDPGAVDFADPGSEQDALAEYLAEFHSETPFDAAETPIEADDRIRNLSVRDEATVAAE